MESKLLRRARQAARPKDRFEKDTFDTDLGGFCPSRASPGDAQAATQVVPERRLTGLLGSAKQAARHPRIGSTDCGAAAP